MHYSTAARQAGHVGCTSRHSRNSGLFGDVDGDGCADVVVFGDRHLFVARDMFDDGDSRSDIVAFGDRQWRLDPPKSIEWSLV
jgi:hypothetical protein